MLLAAAIVGLSGVVLSGAVEAKTEGPLMSRTALKPSVAKKHHAVKKNRVPLHATPKHVASKHLASKHLASRHLASKHDAKPAMHKHEAAKPHRPLLVGRASWYGPGWQHQRTASGSSFDRLSLTAAHRTLPLHSSARVTNLANGKSVTVTVTDRGPHRGDRIIDLSQNAAERLGMRQQGVAMVRIEPLGHFSTR